MDNNQQGKEGGVQQPAASTPVSEQAGPNAGLVTDSKTDLGINPPSTANVQSPFTGKDISMTTPQYAGGNIVTTESGSHA
jgi:hypothetical protein